MTENQITSLTSQTSNEHLTVINEKEVYSFTKHEKKDGQEKATTVVIANQYAVARLSNIDAIINLNKNSNIALSIELARLKKSIAEENGFRTVAQMVHSIHDDLSETTINAYRRVGVVFGDLASEIFKWKDLIPQNVSITNLVQVVGLVDIDKDTDKITQDNAVKAVAEFVDKYILSDRLHLLLPLSKLKEEIKDINNTIDSTSKEVDSKTEDSKTEDSKTEDSKQTEDSKTEDSKQTADSKPGEVVRTKESFIYDLEYLKELYKDNDKIVKLSEKLIKELEKI